MLSQVRMQFTLRRLQERARQSGVQYDLATINKEIKLARKAMKNKKTTLI